MTGPSDGFKRVLETLDRLKIPYMVGGSLASSIHGIVRSTRDIDLVADIKMEHIAPLAAELSGEFYADPEMMRQALQQGRMFNLIHHASSYKFDFYPLSRKPYDQAQFARRATAEFSLDGREALTFYVASPEDTILSKLVWYRAGNQVSERQWSDVIDVVRVKRNLLDLPYLRQWAASLGVADLLEEALRQ
jgi:hypothetical protein